MIHKGSNGSSLIPVGMESWHFEATELGLPFGPNTPAIQNVLWEIINAHNVIWSLTSLQ